MATFSRYGDWNDIRKLEDLYQSIWRSTEMKEDLNRLFRCLRILVVGKSGCGKSTIIRLIVGKGGPTIVRGIAGDQDIAKEWHHPDPDLPLIFHDSNGTDVRGEARFNKIEAFIDKHQNNADIAENIQVVWYVFSAIDNRFLDDGGLLKLLNDYPNLPVILVMTHNDIHEKLSRKIVDDSGLSRLLESISDGARRQRIRETMVKLANDVELMEGGSVKGQWDRAGLQTLTQRTKSLIGKELRLTWVAGQAVDAHEKLTASAKLIISVKRASIFRTYTVGLIPGVQQGQLGYSLLRVGRSLGKLWRIPPELEKAILHEFIFKQGGKAILNNLLTTIGLISRTLAAIFFPGGTLAPREAEHVSALIMTYSLIVLGVILYVRVRKPAADSVEAYSKLCHDFSKSKEANLLKDFVTKNESLWRSLKNSKKQRRTLKNELIRCLREIALHRPSSLFSKFSKNDHMDDNESDLGGASSHSKEDAAQDDGDADEVDDDYGDGLGDNKEDFHNDKGDGFDSDYNDDDDSYNFE